MLTLREVQSNVIIAVAVVFFLAVPLACPLTKLAMTWHDRRGADASGLGHGQTPSMA